MEGRTASALWSRRIPVAKLVTVPPVKFVWELLTLSVPQQEQSNWCWAATSSGIGHFYEARDSPIAQYTIASQAFHRNDCCDEPAASGDCNQPHFLDRALKIVGHFDRMVNTPLDTQAVGAEIGVGRPVGVRIGWAGGGGHAIAIGGFRPNQQSVHIEDPAYGPSDIQFTTLLTAYQGSGTWTHSYFTKV
jgi:Papain-like cysteine protease AvrRpt2